MVGLLLNADAVASQQMAPIAVTAFGNREASALARWKFGPAMPHIRDAVTRTGYGLAFATIFMGLGLGIDKLNNAQCARNAICNGNPVQTGVSFAFLGAVTGATGPKLASQCTRSGRAILGIGGAVLGSWAAATIADVRLFNATQNDPATFRTMGSALLGMGAGAGIITAIC